MNNYLNSTFYDTDLTTSSGSAGKNHSFLSFDFCKLKIQGFAKKIIIIYTYIYIIIINNNKVIMLYRFAFCSLLLAIFVKAGKEQSTITIGVAGDPNDPKYLGIEVYSTIYIYIII